MGRRLSTLVLALTVGLGLGCSEENPNPFAFEQVVYSQNQSQQCGDDDDAVPPAAWLSVDDVPEPEPVEIPETPMLPRPDGCDKRDILFLLDISGSMDGEIAQARSEADKVMRNTADTTPDSRFGVATFGGPQELYNLVFPLTHNYMLLDGVLQTVSDTSGDTERGDYAIASALQMQVGWRSDAHRLIILYTDEHPQEAEGVREVSQTSHARVYAVVRGHETDWQGVLAAPHSVISLGNSEDAMRAADQAIKDACKGMVFLEPARYRQDSPS